MSDFIRFRVEEDGRREAFSRLFERLRELHNARYLGESVEPLTGSDVRELLPEDLREATSPEKLDDLLRRLEACAFMFEGCHFMAKGFAELHVEAVDHPYGGLEIPRALLEAFGMKVLGFMEGGDFRTP